MMYCDRGGVYDVLSCRALQVLVRVWSYLYGEIIQIIEDKQTQPLQIQWFNQRRRLLYIMTTILSSVFSHLSKQCLTVWCRPNSFPRKCPWMWLTRRVSNLNVLRCLSVWEGFQSMTKLSLGWCWSHCRLGQWRSIHLVHALCIPNRASGQTVVSHLDAQNQSKTIMTPTKADVNGSGMGQRDKFRFRLQSAVFVHLKLSQSFYCHCESDWIEFGLSKKPVKLVDCTGQLHRSIG